MDDIKALKFNSADGIYKNSKLKFLKSVTESEPYSFDYFNISLRQENQDSKNFIVIPTKFYNNYQALGKEPTVPINANENQILNYYSSLFSKYDGLSFDKNTFLYEGVLFPDFVTEAILLSTLKTKSMNYDANFDKPYASIEFYVNNEKGQDEVSKTSQDEIKDVTERKKYLKRFVNANNSIKVEKVNYVKNYNKNMMYLYRSFDDPLGKSVAANENVFEKGIPAGLFNNLPNFGANLTGPYKSIDDLLNFKKTCTYEIVGYVITKSVGPKIIKKTYVLNDISMKGYIKLFDSQIIEGKNYSYKIEQINNIFGVTFNINLDQQNHPPFFPNGAAIKQKQVYKITPKESDINSVLNPNGNVQPPYIDKSGSSLLPFYRTTSLKADLFFQPEMRQMVAYSPITSGAILDSPDLQLKIETTETPPSPPDIQIHSRKKESKSILILLSTLISLKKETAGLASLNKQNIIDLGSASKTQKIKTKEFRVFRTEDKPISFSSFPKTPRKIIDPDSPDFVDSIEPNVIYYYYADAVTEKGTISAPSKVLKFQMIEEQAHIFPLLEVYNFGEDKEIITEKLFKKTIKILPNFLQSAVGPQGIVGEYVKTTFSNGYANKLFVINISMVGGSTEFFPTHKIRVTSKKTRRRFDINTVFSYSKITNFKEIPKSAILVLEQELPTTENKPAAATTNIPGENKGSTLKIGEFLKRGQYLQSKNGDYIFVIQSTDGNLVVYKVEDGTKALEPKDWKVVWSPGVPNKDIQIISFQEDGNLVAYDSTNKPVWASDTMVGSNIKANKKPQKLIMQDFGQLELIQEIGKEEFLIWSPIVLQKYGIMPNQLYNKYVEIMSSGQTIYRGDSLKSTNSKYVLTITEDTGEVKLLEVSGSQPNFSFITKWNAGIQGAEYLTFTSDGDIAAYNTNKQVLWETNFGGAGSNPTFLALNNSGELMMGNAAGQKWQIAKS